MTFDITDKTMDSDTVTATATSLFPLCNLSQVTNKMKDVQYNFSTLENDRFKLDGTFCFADGDYNFREYGWWSDTLCDAAGVFTPNQVLTLSFGNIHSIAGLTFTFDIANNEYAVDFDIKIYNSAGTLISTENVVGNTETAKTVTKDFSNFKKIEIIIKKWSKPYRRVRIIEVEFGVTKVYTDDNLVRVSLVEELDLSSGTLPSAEFKFTVDNSNREFNILNPTGFYKFLQERQTVRLEIGLEYNGGIEYIPVGQYLLSEWVSNEDSLTASFTARSNLDALADFEYENLVAKTGYNLSRLAQDIFSICKITNYRLDSSLSSISTKALVKKTNCKNVIQMIAIAGRCGVFIDRRGNYVIAKTPSLINPVDTISLDAMYTEPKITLEKPLKSVTVKFYEGSGMEIPTETMSGNNIFLTGDNVVVDNTLINDYIQAQLIANWLLNLKNNRAVYSVDWRGNQAHELNDVVSIQNSYGANKNVIITKNELNYEGYLSAKMEARGAVT
ncbi:hypothetical protein [Neobacillus sp. NPDC093127]|uniref:hypothetical protein n=1 Tax=Neobacillus sp. NPDC093127 TaxID=3364296 RepID=UPI0037F321C9